jgi:hypothetical protein
MSFEKASRQEHPSIQTLSLFARRDAPSITRLRVARHIRRCAECEQQVVLFRSATLELRREATAETLTGFEAIADWRQIEREMLGNIAVGVAAARCVDRPRRGAVYLWRGAFLTGMAALFVAGWMTHIPKEETDHLTASLRRLVGVEQQDAMGTVVRTTPEGIAVRSQGTTLTILHPHSAVVTVSGSSAVEARYVDEDTGQVTITTVYGQ